MRILFAALAVMAAMATAPALAQAPVIHPPAPDAAGKPDPETAEASAVETAKSSRGRTTVGGRPIDYTATAGTLTIRNDEGVPTASVFYVAYTVDQPKGAPPRPVTFAFNGGPGSSTMWLHMGSFGPMRVDTPTADMPAPVSARFGPNAESIIDKTDIVFIDAVGTGFSRPLGKSTGADFFSVDKDIDAFAKAVTRYLTKADRWASPKFIIGESYGTLRAGGLAYVLQNRGVSLNGVVLISSIMNFGARQPGNDQDSLGALPTLAAAAWYHRRLANRPESLEAYVEEVRKFTMGPYLSALAKGDDLAPAERDDIARRAAAYIGVNPQVMINSNLRIGPDRFRKELLRDQGRTIGRLDARFTGTEFDAGTDGADYDAADTSLSGAYVAAVNKYLFETLGYETRLAYRHNFYSGVRDWDWSHRAPGQGSMASANTAFDLGQAMRENPHLKVLSMNGYYDMATPFHATEYDLKHMNLDPSLRKNLTFTYYPAGHMIYIEPASRAAMKRDFDQFYDAALAR